MIWLNWLPWRYILRRAAKAHGFLDPLALMGRLQRFAQPSEVAEPIELLRAGVVFHARGLINSRVVQHNLDWVWPYWIERQFNPYAEAFVPRGFSITHINLTHRNWTAVGLPDVEELPIVDPRGLVTPWLDQWSLDGWVVAADGRRLLPSRAEQAKQVVDLNGGVRVRTETESNGLRLTAETWAEEVEGEPTCRVRLQAVDTDQSGTSAEPGEKPGWLILALRPYNPEGISFIHDIRLSDDRQGWKVDGEPAVRFSQAPDAHHASDYKAGDVAIHLRDAADGDAVSCDVGMATAAAAFPLKAGDDGTSVEAVVPLRRETFALAKSLRPTARPRPRDWDDVLAPAAKLDIPDAEMQQLYEIALRTLILHAPQDVYPGPYTYKRFWFRDAAFIVSGLLAAGFEMQAERALDQFPSRQSQSGYFHSQEGEWDSNGEALWIFARFCRMTGRAPKTEWRNAILRGARWIARKRIKDAGEKPHNGLMPAGFSAEHLGPNDYYYWDDFWSIAGLEAAAELARAYNDSEAATRFGEEAKDFRKAVDRSLASAEKRLGKKAMPASPYRRMDAGAIGSVAAGYPLQLFPVDDPRLTESADWLIDNSFVRGGFFQDMIHSGINAYLTLHIAQVLLRSGDDRYFQLMRAVADLASPTGQWPEAIHPHTLGGCMGDGQHVWAAAEWIIMLRNCFLREEGNRLVVAAGIPEEWLGGAEPLSFGPALTEFGKVSVSIAPEADGVVVTWKANWRGEPPEIEVRLSGHDPVTARPEAGEVRFKRGRAA
ncbi:MAG: hypothetical protein R3316_09810 [Rhodovibrionaceae bacterium]|nr:hypothetical protein [Rhodovibrionaceae bacterium]